MTWKTVNVLSIFYTRKTVKKLAGNIPGVSTVHGMGMGQVNCPFTYSVFTVFQARTLGFVPSVMNSNS